jgi:peptide/nickel transport system permease protein
MQSLTKRTTAQNLKANPGMYLVALFVFIALLSIVYTPHDPFAMNAARKFAPPSLQHLFGTDNFGRDILSRTMVGVRYSLLFSCATLAVSFVCGVAIGLAAASTYKIIGHIIMRVVDAVNAIPVVLLSLVLIAAFSARSSAGAGTGNAASLIIAMSAVFTPAFVRITRNEALQLRELGYIDHARVLGASSFRIMYAHILPNLAPSLINTAVIVMVNSITVESVLSYLGLGIQPPTPSLGRMLFDAQGYLFNAPWAAVLPGLTIVLLLCGLNYFAGEIQTHPVSRPASRSPRSAPLPPRR